MRSAPMEPAQRITPGHGQIRSRKLRALLEGIDVQANALAGDLEVTQIACDSRKVQPGSFFFALHGAKADGNAFVPEAIARGAVAIASETPAPPGCPPSIAWIQVPEARRALALVSANFFDHPAQALELVAVTGTNGKTTTTSLVDAIIKASGTKTGLFGTIAYHTPPRNPWTCKDFLPRFATPTDTTLCWKPVPTRL